MTTIYIPMSLENYELCHPMNQDDFEHINTLVNGVARNQNWTPIAMQLIREDEGRKLLESDSPWLGPHALIFRPRAVEVLGPLLANDGELLPLRCAGAEVRMYNPTRVLDALDENASTVIRFSGGRIMRISHYVFRPQIVHGVGIFKIPNLRVSPTFVSQCFVDLWRSAGLRGLEFKQLWGSALS